MDRVQDLEEQIAHLLRAVDDLSDIARDQTARIERLERQVHQLRERAAQAEMETGAQISLADQRPPHW